MQSYMKSNVSRLFAPTISLLILNLFPGIIQADECGKDARVPVPDCILIKGPPEYNYFAVTNTCDFEMTLKFDRPGPDSRRLITPQSSIFDESPATVTCCPNYGRCK